jgi:energy-converting hydrogenase A subunit R
MSLDKYDISQQEKERLKEIAQEIAQMRPIDIPSTAKAIEHFSDDDQAAIKRLDQIFWNEIAKMNAGKLLTDVVTVGGEQKAESVRDAAERLGVRLANVMYVGDSITDVEAFKLVRNGGGLAVSFNGNSYAVKNAEIAVMSESNLVVALIADLFCRLGRDQALKVIMFWCRQAVEESGANSDFLRQIYATYPRALPRVEIVKTQNVESLVKESSEFREKVRGLAIGKLG